jgi:rod shape determining protein RodA
MGNNLRHLDPIIILSILFLGAFGLFLLITVDRSLFLSQLFFFAISIVGIVLLSMIDPAIIRWSAPFVYVFSVIFLAMSYLGPEVRGATRWLIVGPIRIQPSELVKPFFLLAMAELLARFPPRKMTMIAFHTALFLIPFLLVFKQPDLGSSIVYAAMWIAMMVAAGLRVRYVAGSALGFGILLPLIWEILKPYQRSRIMTFLDPALDPKGAGYNAIQAMIAVGSGQLFGRGLGLGTQSHLAFLPEYHTDFIFATMIEELGFFGGMAVFVGYIVLLWRIVAPLVAQRVEEADTYIYSIGLFSMILVQVFVNAGMNMGIIPITGITLPLISYGGSSLLSIAASFGFLFAIRSNETGLSD